MGKGEARGGTGVRVGGAGVGLEGTLLLSSETLKADPGLKPEPRRGLSSHPRRPDPVLTSALGRGSL